jgi:hypothetical protein
MMTPRDAFPWLHEVIGKHGVFGYGISEDECRFTAHCAACDRVVDLPLTSPQVLVAAVERFEREHLISCEALIPAAKERLRQLFDQAPSTSDPDELRQWMSGALKPKPPTPGTA